MYMFWLKRNIEGIKVINTMGVISPSFEPSMKYIVLKQIRKTNVHRGVVKV